MDNQIFFSPEVNIRVYCLFSISSQLAGDVMWALYGFMKNLPDKNATIDSFLDYSVAFYHAELLRHLKAYR